MTLYPGRIQLIAIDRINVNEGPRPTDDAAVDALAKSMVDIGLMVPISVVRRHDLDENRLSSGYDIVAGRHRLAAAKKLGWKNISAVILDDLVDNLPIGDLGESFDIVVEMWSIAENLYRAPLTKKQRDEHIRRYADLLAKKDLAEAEAEAEAEGKSDNLTDFNHVGAGRGNKGTATKVAEQLGLSQRTVRRALVPPKPKSECKPMVNKASQTERAVQLLLDAWEVADWEARAGFVRIANVADFIKNMAAPKAVSPVVDEEGNGLPKVDLPDNRNLAEKTGRLNDITHVADDGFDVPVFLTKDRRQANDGPEFGGI